MKSQSLASGDTTSWDAPSGMETPFLMCEFFLGCVSLPENPYLIKEGCLNCTEHRRHSYKPNQQELEKKYSHTNSAISQTTLSLYLKPRETGKILELRQCVYSVIIFILSPTGTVTRNGQYHGTWTKSTKRRDSITYLMWITSSGKKIVLTLKVILWSVCVLIPL